MNGYSRNIIGHNVKSTRLSLGLSQLNFSMLTGLSKATIVNIESGKKGYKLDLLENLINFLDLSLSELSAKDYFPSKDLRETLINKYKNIRPDYHKVLSQTPEIVYAIKHRLLNSVFLKQPKEIREIRDYFLKFGWNYKGPSISNALKRMPEFILIEKHPSKGNTHTYVQKPNRS